MPKFDELLDRLHSSGRVNGLLEAQGIVLRYAVKEQRDPATREMLSRVGDLIAQRARDQEGGERIDHVVAPE